MNKYQFTIYPAEKLPLALIEYWVICPMIRHPPFESTGPTTHVLFLQLTKPTVTFPFPIFISWWSEWIPDSTSVIQTPSFRLASYKRSDASLTESSCFRLSDVWFTLKFTSKLEKHNNFQSLIQASCCQIKNLTLNIRENDQCLQRTELDDL